LLFFRVVIESFLLMVDLSVTFCGVRFDNPLVLASGVLGVTGDGMARLVESGAGGVTTKSLWPVEHHGHKNPVIIGNEHVMVNAVGLPDGGPDKAREEMARYRARTKAPLIANIVGGVMDDYAAIARLVVEMNPDIIEINISCPNVEDEFGKPMACSIVKAAEVTRLVKAITGAIPVTVKLSPNVDSIVAIGRSVMEAGADGLTAINTLGPGIVIDLETRTPVLANKVGGVSGPAIKPLAVKHVYDLYKNLKAPIIGTGGVTNGRDAIEMLMAGATLVGVGSALWYRGQDAFTLIRQEMIEWCETNNVQKLSDLIGTVHANS
jgi:dihydroorotate dehydrogenase (NAD+) catalytic subunit